MNTSLEFEREDRKLKEIEEKILRIPGIRPDLDKLVRAGADRRQVIFRLALVVFGREESWRRVMEQKRAALRRLAKQLRTIVDEAERLAEDPLCGGHFWLAFFGLSSPDEVLWPAKRDPKAPAGKMLRALAEQAENKAKLLGKISREGSYFYRRSPAAALCHYVREATGDYHDDEVARLLTDAYEAVGLGPRSRFSAVQLQKLRKRHMRRASI